MIRIKEALQQERHPSFLRDVGQLTIAEPPSSHEYSIAEERSRIQRESGVERRVGSIVSSCDENCAKPDETESFRPYKEAVPGDRMG